MSSQTNFELDAVKGFTRMLADFGRQTMNLVLDSQNMLFWGFVAANDAALKYSKAEMALRRELAVDLARAGSSPALWAAWQNLGVGQFAMLQSAMKTEGDEPIPAPSSMDAD